MRPNEQRQESRVGLEVPVEISIGSQLTLHGTLKDLSTKSAFITMKSSVYLQNNDEVGFIIRLTPEKDTDVITGMARISRTVCGLNTVRDASGAASRLVRVSGTISPSRANTV